MTLKTSVGRVDVGIVPVNGDILEAAFREGNTPWPRPKTKLRRSLSVGDWIQLPNGVKHYVLSFGFGLRMPGSAL